jgi:predicted RecB family endonuclease
MERKITRHLFLHNGVGYEGELALFRAAHIGASQAEVTADLPGLRPMFLFRVADGATTQLLDDPVAVCRFVHEHPNAEVSTVPLYS